VAQRKLQCVRCCELLTRGQINHYAESGTRLVCAEAVGYVRSTSANEQYASKCMLKCSAFSRYFTLVTAALAPSFLYRVGQKTTPFLLQ